MRSLTLPRRALLALCLAMSAGCGGKNLELTGRVNLDGEPLAHAEVVLKSASADGQSYAGTTDSGGSFRIGAVKPGEYKVYFGGTQDTTEIQKKMAKQSAGGGSGAGMSKAQMGKSGVAPTATDPTRAASAKAAMKEDPDKPKAAGGPVSVPTKFRSPDTSGLAWATADGTSKVFDLKK